MPIEGALTPPWSVVVVGSRPGFRWCSGSSTFLPIWSIWQQPPNHGGCCPIAAEILVGYRRMRALRKALDPLDQFKSSAAHSPAIKAFELVASLSPLAGDASLPDHGVGRPRIFQKNAVLGLLSKIGFPKIYENVRQTWGNFRPI